MAKQAKFTNKDWQVYKKAMISNIIGIAFNVSLIVIITIVGLIHIFPYNNILDYRLFILTIPIIFIPVLIFEVKDLFYICLDIQKREKIVINSLCTVSWGGDSANLLVIEDFGELDMGGYNHQYLSFFKNKKTVNCEIHFSKNAKIILLMEEMPNSFTE